jgi:hypothetical protein
MYCVGLEKAIGDDVEVDGEDISVSPDEIEAGVNEEDTDNIKIYICIYQ